MCIKVELEDNSIHVQKNIISPHICLSVISDRLNFMYFSPKIFRFSWNQTAVSVSGI